MCSAMFWPKLWIIPILEAAEEQSAITDDDSSRNPPLGAALEQQRTNDLHEDQSDHKISNPSHRAGHHRPAIVQGAGLLKLLIAAQGNILDRSKTETDDAAGNQPNQRTNHVQNLNLHDAVPFCF